MATYVLIHGACQGAWCWYKIIVGLQAQGHLVLAPDLPAHGKDKTPITQVSWKIYIDHICALLAKQTEPVILVGHSFSGSIISQVAEYHPDKVQRLIYIAARILADGESMIDNAANKITANSARSLFADNKVMSADGCYFSLKETGIKDSLYNMCADEDVALAKLLLVPELEEPYHVSVHVTEKNYGRIPRMYVSTLHDQAIPIAVQKQMLITMPCQKVVTLATDHSPFFSAPDELLTHLLE